MVRIVSLILKSILNQDLRQAIPQTFVQQEFALSPSWIRPKPICHFGFIRDSTGTTISETHTYMHKIPQPSLSHSPGMPLDRTGSKNP